MLVGVDTEGHLKARRHILRKVPSRNKAIPVGKHTWVGKGQIEDTNHVDYELKQCAKTNLQHVGSFNIHL
jgi:hypothetical protein